MENIEKTRALKYLRKVLGQPSSDFRPGQWEAIHAILRRQRLLLVQRTGWGKSMVYFLGTKLLRDAGGGPTLLISPLLSLMRNQIQAAQRIGVRAETINSTNTEDWTDVEARLVRGEVDVLLISPERLANDDFRERVLSQVADRIGLFVVDEAHCISDWGHDFRPDYRRIVQILRLLPKNIPVLATTATANTRVVNDVVSQLGNLQVSRGPLIRESLSLQNVHLPSQADRLAWLAETLPKLPGSGIIYTLTVRDSEQVASWLQSRGLPVEAYHARVESEDSDGDNAAVGPSREELEDRLLRNQVKALVATVALGMGFDKPDLGFVIHYQRPGSVVHYYQQVGRAGRAVDHAFGILLSGEEDTEITDYFIRTAFPPEAHVKEILDVLERSSDGLTLGGLLKEINLTKSEINKVLKILAVESPSPVAKQGNRWSATPVNYKLDHQRIQKLIALRQKEQSEMMNYMGTSQCLMEFLGQALDDEKARPCGKCANCAGKNIVPTDCSAGLANQASLFLKRSFVMIPPRRQWPADAFHNYTSFRGRIRDELRAEEGRALSTWGDSGWGQLVRDGKYKDGHLPDELIEGCLEMIQAWNPNPQPSWMTCIPSLTHSSLLPDFTRRLAAALGLPFELCIIKARHTRPQKEMLNSTQQASNLDGAFQIISNRWIGEPVYLVDDLVTSRWTLTIAAALLRQTGCPAVFPLALSQNPRGQD